MWRGDAFVDGGLGDLIADYGAGVGEGGAFYVEGRACAKTCKLGRFLLVLGKSMEKGGLLLA